MIKSVHWPKNVYVEIVIRYTISIVYLINLCLVYSRLESLKPRSSRYEAIFS